jgi:beta-1,4-mannosyl-glycoprotein beta-1,4-N-acetylglucosaminyltransferase
MKIYDCFMYFDEDLILDLRLNILDKYVDYFVIVESMFTHKGDKRNLNFKIEKFKKFEKKIIYLVYDQSLLKIKKISPYDTDYIKSCRYIENANLRENGQRNFIKQAINNANDEDIILVSDVDEIPNLEHINFKKKNSKIILFNQDMFYYKFNLKLPNLIWTGTKACKKKDFESAQWLRNVKDKKYPFYRIDTYFSKTKYINCEFINNGGWHFTNIKTAKQIKLKLESYLHHIEFDKDPLSTNEINKIMHDKVAIYDLSADQRENKVRGKKLENYVLHKLPKYLQDNLEKYKEWID